MPDYKTFILEAKGPHKYVSSQQRAQNAQKSLSKLQKHMQVAMRSSNKLNQSHGPPKLKQLRVQRNKALQNYLKTAIMVKQQEIKNIKTPE